MTSQNINKESLRDGALCLLAQFESAEAIIEMAYLNGQQGAESITEAEGQEIIAALKAEQIDIEKVIPLIAFATEESVGRAFANNAREQNHTFQFEAAEIAFQMKVVGLDIFEEGVEVEAPEITPEMQQKADESFENMMTEVWNAATADFTQEELNVATKRVRESFLEEQAQGLYDHLNLNDSPIEES